MLLTFCKVIVSCFLEGILLILYTVYQQHEIKSIMKIARVILFLLIALFISFCFYLGCEKYNFQCFHELIADYPFRMSWTARIQY